MQAVQSAGKPPVQRTLLPGFRQRSSGKRFLASCWKKKDRNPLGCRCAPFSERRAPRQPRVWFAWMSAEQSGGISSFLPATPTRGTRHKCWLPVAGVAW